ncbi:unnamed protein product, partial [Prorocentrum cordatum]
DFDFDRMLDQEALEQDIQINAHQDDEAPPDPMDVQFPELLHRSWGGLPVPEPSVEATRVWTMEERDGLWQKAVSKLQQRASSVPTGPALNLSCDSLKSWQAWPSKAAELTPEDLGILLEATRINAATAQQAAA